MIVYGEAIVTADHLIVALLTLTAPVTFWGAFKENGVTWTFDESSDKNKLLIITFTEKSYVIFAVKPESLLCVIFPYTSRVLMFDGVVIS